MNLVQPHSSDLPLQAFPISLRTPENRVQAKSGNFTKKKTQNFEVEAARVAGKWGEYPISEDAQNGHFLDLYKPVSQCWLAPNYTCVGETPRTPRNQQLESWRAEKALGCLVLEHSVGFSFCLSKELVDTVAFPEGTPLGKLVPLRA